MSEFAKSIGVMVIPTNKITDDSHCTIVYAGEDDEHDYATYTDIEHRCKTVAHIEPPFVAEVKGKMIMGDQTPALLIESPSLYRIRMAFQRFNRSEYTVYRPHLSVPYLDTTYPKYFIFDRIAFWFGDDRREWSLCSGM